MQGVPETVWGICGFIPMAENIVSKGPESSKVERRGRARVKGSSNGRQRRRCVRDVRRISRPGPLLRSNYWAAPNSSDSCAIELDDASHQSKGRRQRDEFLKGACEAAAVPLIQVPAQPGYVIDEVKQLIAPYLADKETLYKEFVKAPIPYKSETDGKVCPKCSASMVKRVAKNGTYAGKEFWACSAFPKCKTVEAIKV